MAPAALEVPRLGDEEKDRLADLKRDEAIEGFKRLIPKLEEGSGPKADLLYRLAELYWEKSQYLYHLEMKRFLEAEEAGPAKADHRESVRLRSEAMRLYEDLLRGWPDWPQRDEVLFALGYNLQELGRREEAVKHYLQLIKEFPKSQFVPDAYIELGNHFFEANQLAKARSWYERAQASNVPKVYAYAVYKLAWCDYNAGAYEEGLGRLHTVVDYATSRGEELGDLKTESLNDLPLFYVQLNQPEQAFSYFKQKAPPKRQARLITRTAEGLAEAGLFPGAILLWHRLLEEEPLGDSAPEYQQSIVRAHEGLRQRDNVREEVGRMVSLYRPGSAWWQAHAAQESVLRNAFEVTESGLRNLVTEYHQEAQKTQQVETYRLARDFYKQYVDTFASGEAPSLVADSAFNMRFFYAEILWALEEWEAAAAQYDAVVAFAIPDRDSAREASNEAYRKNAAYSAVLAYDKLVRLERGQLSQRELKDGQKVDEAKAKGQVERRGRLVRHEERLVAACDTYNRLYPGNPDEVDLRYQAAVIHYDRHHELEAARRLREIIARFPEERRSRDAADLAMFIFESRQEWQELSAFSRELLANRKLTRPGTEFAQRVARVVEGSQYKYVFEIVYQKQKEPLRAAEAFLALVAEFPRSENADRALTSAMVLFEEVRQLDRSAAAAERVLAEHPGSPFELKVRYTLARLHERMGDFRKAAAMYAAFVEAHDAATAARAKQARGKAVQVKREGAEEQPGSAEESQVRREEERKALLAEAAPWVPDALYNAGLWWDAVGELPKAVAAWRSYMARFKERPDVPQMALDLGQLHERYGRWADAARAYGEFSERFARDKRTTPAQHYLARYREMRDWQQARETSNAERLRGELLRGWSRLGNKEREQLSVLNAYAHARFLELEPLWRRYTEIRFTRVNTLRGDLLAKQRELQRVESAYTQVLSVGSGEWGIAALTRLGLAYADFARNVLASPDPQGLDEEQLALYREELQNLALPLEDKATEALEAALGKAHELSLYGEWTRAAQEQLERYRPGTWPQVQVPPLQAGESYPTSDIVREPGLEDVAPSTAGSEEARP
jgi:cellulose synthase operon protein C